jgi:hypothetical protein
MSLKKLLVLVMFASSVFGATQKHVVWDVPSSGVSVGGGLPFGYFKLQNNNTVIIPVTLTYNDSIASTHGPGVYQSRFEGVSWIPQPPRAVVESTDGLGVGTKPSDGVALSPSSFKPTPTPRGRPVLSVENSDLPAGGSVIATEGAESDELDRVPLMNFALISNAGKDITVTQIQVPIVASGGSAVATTAYLYSGTWLLASASCEGGVAVFEDIDLIVGKRATKFLSVKVDIREAGPVATEIKASVSGKDILMAGNGFVGGTVSSGELVVRNVGVVATAIGTPKTVKEVLKYNPAGDKTYTVVHVTYNISLTAKGGDIVIGSQPDLNSFRFSILRNGIRVE